MKPSLEEQLEILRDERLDEKLENSIKQSALRERAHRRHKKKKNKKHKQKRYRRI